MRSEAQGTDTRQASENVVLVVDDDALTQTVIVEIVNSFGYTTKAADDGWTGLSQIHHIKPALVIMDLSMPNLDGFAATLLIREMYTRQELPIIACTAEKSVSNRKRGFAYGMNDWIAKPVRPHHLHAVIKRWLDRRNDGGDEEFNDVESLHYLPTFDHRVLELVYSQGAQADSFSQRKQFVVDYLSSAPELLNSTKKEIASARYSLAAMHLRKLKQVSVIVGSPKLSRMCEILERALNEGLTSTDDVNFITIYNEFLKLKLSLEKKYGLLQPGFFKRLDVVSRDLNIKP